jgi:hypothetical protein
MTTLEKGKEGRKNWRHYEIFYSVDANRQLFFFIPLPQQNEDHK